MARFRVFIRSAQDRGAVWEGFALDAAHAERRACEAFAARLGQCVPDAPTQTLPDPRPMPDGWAPEAPDVIAAEALEEWAEARRRNAAECEAEAERLAAEGLRDDMREPLGEAAGSRALAGYADALAPVLADVLSADVLREAAEALDAAAAAFDTVAPLFETAAESPETLPRIGAAVRAQRNAREAAARLRQRAETAERVEREAAARAWAESPEVTE